MKTTHCRRRRLPAKTMLRIRTLARAIVAETAAGNSLPEITELLARAAAAADEAATIY